MTIANERLVDFLGLQFELCYVKASGDAVWILADKIRRKDQIALEMLRIFNRFMRIGKSLDRINSKNGLALAGPDGTAKVDSNPGNASNNAPYAHCIGVRIRVQEHIAAFHARPGFDPRILADAPRLSSGALLDANVQLQLDDPILSMLTTPTGNASTKALPNASPSTQRPRRPKSAD